ncbi:MAG TPA: kelch repeat-containing protein, partial [Chloroflexota bacterium]|nr:kelch repeat-containing protein [Chloroflexota bacterium]
MGSAAAPRTAVRDQHVRYEHTATLLLNGAVLIAGGFNFTAGPLSDAEVYNPRTGKWLLTAPMRRPRHGHSATLLANGKVLVTGGVIDNPGTVTSSAEVYDPHIGQWTLIAPMLHPRTGQTATLLA